MWLGSILGIVLCGWFASKYPHYKLKKFADLVVFYPMVILYHFKILALLQNYKTRLF